MYNFALQGVDYSRDFDPSQNNLMFLKDLSSKDGSWDVIKTQSIVTSDYINNTDLHKHHKRMSNCADILEMALHNQVDGTKKLKLKRAWFCGHRECPLCSVSRSRVWQKRLMGGIPPMIAANPKIKFLFLTLTVKNCDVTDLRTTLDSMNNGFKRLMDRRNIAKLTHGYLRRFEVTKNKDGTAHPHFHVVLAVQPSYFGADYINQAEWTDLWKQSLQIDYTPVVNIKAVKATKKSPDVHLSIVNEVTKVVCYSAKSAQILDDRDWFLEHTRQVARTKELVFSGLFREYISEKPIEEKDILNASNDDEEENMEEEIQELIFRYLPNWKRYATKV
jgi:plasmid rolling circle replication initiator protein Rep